MRSLRKRVTLRPTDSTLVITTGMGSSAASAGARALIDAGAKGFASWGMAVAGILTGAGEILLPTEIVAGARRTARSQLRKGWRERLSATIMRAADGC